MRGSATILFFVFFELLLKSPACCGASKKLLSSSKSPHGQGAFNEPLPKKPSPRQGPRRGGVTTSHGQSGVFLVLPEGERIFNSFSCRRPQKIYCVGVKPTGPVDIQEGLSFKKIKFFFACFKTFPCLLWCLKKLQSSSKSPHGQGAFYEPLHKKPKPPAGPSPGRR